MLTLSQHVALGAPKLGVFRASIARGALVRAGTVLGTLHVLNRVYRVRAPAGVAVLPYSTTTRVPLRIAAATRSTRASPGLRPATAHATKAPGPGARGPSHSAA